MNTTVYRGLSVMLLAVAAPALADSVTGQFALEGKAPLKPAQIAAFRTADQDTFVLLTAKPVNRAAIAKSSDPYSVAINDPAVQGTDYMTFFVSKNGNVSLNATVGGEQYMDSSKMDLVANCKTNTPEHVTCTAKTAKPVKPMSGPAWSLDVSFDSAVTHPDGK